MTAWGFLAAALAYSLLAGALLVRARDRASGTGDPKAGDPKAGAPKADEPPSSSRLMTLAVMASAAWAWVGMADEVAIDNRFALSVGIVDVARYGLWFLFLQRLARVRFAGAKGRWNGRWLLDVLAWGLPLAAVAMQVSAWASGSFYRGLAYAGHGTLFVELALPVFGLVLLEQIFRGLPDDLRWNAKPLLLALLCLFAFDIYLYSTLILFGRVDSDSLVVRAPVQAVTCLLLFAAARRHAGWMSHLKVSHSAALHTATLILVGAYLSFIAIVGYYVRHFGGELGRALQLGVLCVALVGLAVLLGSAVLRARLRVFVGKNFFSYRYDYRTEWLRFTARLSAKESLQDVGELVIRGLSDLIVSQSGALWTVAPDRGEYLQRVRWKVPEIDAAEPAASSFARFLLEREWIFDLDEYRTTPRRYDDVVVPDWLAYSAHCWLVVPLIVGERLVGFVTLSKSSQSPQLNWEVRDLLKTAARQAAGFMAQMEATEALIEARKFDAFNRMSAFVVHDLKNIVTQLSLMMQNAKRLQDNPEFRQDMLDTVENSLEKMRQLMLQLREGNAPEGTRLGVQLAPIVRDIEAAATQRGRRLEVQVIHPLVTRGDAGRIARVLGHVVQNALDATPVEGRVWLKLERAVGRALLVVGDTGVGMSAEFVRTRLFKPFSTTKQAGMGIGAYESFQYIRELGGTIAVDSEPGRGTVVSIHLPLFETEDRPAPHGIASASPLAASVRHSQDVQA